jgi:hypothetical protein
MERKEDKSIVNISLNENVHKISIINENVKRDKWKDKFQKDKILLNDRVNLCR